MGDFTLTIHTDNAAFDPDPRPELAAILRHIAHMIETGATIHRFQTVYDVNGNDVGRYRLADV